MSQHLNLYTQRGCVGCTACEGGVRNVARSLVLWTLAIFTLGAGLLILPFYRRCVYCGHRAFMSRHQVPTGYGLTRT